MTDEQTLLRLHHEVLAAVESSSTPIFAHAGLFPSGHHIAPHRHRRAQLLYPRKGVVVIGAASGRWMVPPEHAVWIAPNVEHAVEMLGEVEMLSIYVQPALVEGGGPAVRVVAVDELTRSLVVEATRLSPLAEADRRASLVTALLLDTMPRLPEAPLSLPFPREPRLAALCRRFMADPSPHLAIADWAEALAMSRRTFTRTFRRETGISFATWRQQACLLTALPRLSAGEAVTRVALDLGYDSAAAFTTMFRRMLGAAPRDYFRRGAGP